MKKKEPKVPEAAAPSGRCSGVVHETDRNLRQIELCCAVVLMLAILFAACATAMTVCSVTHPPSGFLVMDYVSEIALMAAVLNIGLPSAIVALGLWIILQARRSTLDPVAVALGVVGFLGVFGCAVAIWAGLAAMHGPGINLWRSRIWWG